MLLFEDGEKEETEFELGQSVVGRGAPEQFDERARQHPDEQHVEHKANDVQADAAITVRAAFVAVDRQGQGFVLGCNKRGSRPQAISTLPLFD